MRSWILSGRVLLVIAALLPLQAFAYTVSASLLALRPTGDGASAFLQLANKAMKPVAVELTLHEHHKDLDGQGVTGDQETGDDFIVYPSQLVLLPGDEATVQVRWIGAPVLDMERAYTLMTREVPIPRPAAEEPENATGVRLDITVLMNYEVRIYVTPPGAKPKIVVESVSERLPPSGDGSVHVGSTQLEIVLMNQGTARRSLADMTLVLTPLGPTGAPLPQHAVTLPAGTIPALHAPVLAGARRRLLIPRPAGLPAGPVRVTLAE